MTEEDDAPWNLLNEKERIDFLKNYAESKENEILQRGLDSIFGANKYKPKKEDLWERLDRGKKLVRGIILYHDD